MPETFEFTGEMTKRCIERDPPMERKETHCDLLDTILRKKGPFFNKSEFRPPRKGCRLIAYGLWLMAYGLWLMARTVCPSRRMRLPDWTGQYKANGVSELIDFDEQDR